MIGQHLLLKATGTLPMALAFGLGVRTVLDKFEWFGVCLLLLRLLEPPHSFLLGVDFAHARGWLALVAISGVVELFRDG